MKKRLVSRLAVFLSALLLCGMAAAIAASADAIWSPQDDFYENHFGDCDYEDRYYLANGPKGYITIYQRPGSSRIVDQFENGNEFYVSFTYTRGNGEKWGVVQFRRDQDKAVATWMHDEFTKTGWIPMEDLLAVYDHYAFVEDHRDEFKDYLGGFYARDYEGKINFWTYPGSGVVRSSVSMKDREGGELSFSYIYTDEDGREWGYVGYFYANEGWVCLSDPTNPDLPANEVVYEGLIPAAKPQKPAVSSDMTLVIVLVAAVMVLTAVIIVLIFRKKAARGKANHANHGDGSSGSPE
ncbi:MAG TPA: hypothetical protein PK369_04340 [Thermoclostridium sp.]|nr:hypothetical protein [Clostridiaceae bacterium]HOQ75785.1 hypothetical protein [Thermoclostridium sp.]HPU45436.1 hypothetical protein [Thermoclostridium sp.]